MSKVIVDCQSINEFSKKIKDNSSRLIDILDSMKNDSLLYENMIDSKVGTLYKEVMIQQLDKEKELIMNKSDKLSNKLEWIIETYGETIEDIKESIGE